MASCLLETLCHNSLKLDGLPEHYLSARQRRLAAIAAADVAADSDARAMAVAGVNGTATCGAAGGGGSAAAQHDFYDVQELTNQPFHVCMHAPTHPSLYNAGL